MNAENDTRAFFEAGSSRGRLVLAWRGEPSGRPAPCWSPERTPSRGAAEPTDPGPALAPVGFSAGSGPTSPALLLFDGSPGARAAVRHGAAILGGAPALVVCLWEPAERGLLSRTAVPGALGVVAELAEELDRTAETRAERTAAVGAALAGELGLAAAPLAVRAPGPLLSALARVVDERAARVVVLGARGRSCARALVAGSLSHAAIHRLGCPVLVVPPDAGGAEIPGAAEGLATPSALSVLAEDVGRAPAPRRARCPRAEEQPFEQVG